MACLTCVQARRYPDRRAQARRCVGLAPDQRKIHHGARRRLQRAVAAGADLAHQELQRHFPPYPQSAGARWSARARWWWPTPYRRSRPPSGRRVRRARAGGRSQPADLESTYHRLRLHFRIVVPRTLPQPRVPRAPALRPGTHRHVCEENAVIAPNWVVAYWKGCVTTTLKNSSAPLIKQTAFHSSNTAATKRLRYQSRTRQP
ncbi:MAG: hypothetical protein JWP34_4179 [Massilia sp.]|nr:hypothetical protein [Massilia sp.]